MFKINEKYNYPELKQINGTVRLYDTGAEKLPSVTTILSSTGDKTALIEWRNRVGEEEANRITREATGLGSLVHKHVEHYVAGIDRPSGNNLVHKMAREMSDRIIVDGLKDVDEVWGMEVKLFYPGLYAGTTDLVGIYKGRESIMDHKTAKVLKKPEWMEDYFMQTTAYALAHNELFGTDIKHGVLFMTTRDNNYKTYTIEGTEFAKYTDMWLQRVEDYYKQK